MPCYDTSLYIDDLHIKDDSEAASLIASEALEGADRGHKAFKIKVGRGAMHMPLKKERQEISASSAPFAKLWAQTRLS